MKSIYVGNLPFKVTESELAEFFSQFGKVYDVKLINDRDTGRPRGFGFVRMDDEPALAAIAAVDGTQMGGRTLKVNEARERVITQRVALPAAA